MAFLSHVLLRGCTRPCCGHRLAACQSALSKNRLRYFGGDSHHIRRYSNSRGTTHIRITMPEFKETPTVPVAANGLINGVNGERRPETPTGGMSLTEYSANPSTPSEEKRARIKKIVPEEYLLPTGYPDVSLFAPLTQGNL